MRLPSKLLALAFACLSLWMPASFAQVDTGAILGTVTDPNGGVIPGAQVTITQEGTGISSSTQTRADGTYIFSPVRIGAYTIEVKYTGFKTERRSGVSVNIQQQAVVDITLSPGAITESVTVEAAAPVLQTQSGSTGAVIESHEINNLPLSGRNYNFLARLSTGVTIPQPEGRGLSATGWFAANGTRPAQNNFLLDGIDNNSNNVDFLSGAAYVLKPPVDAISEFKVQTSAFSAEFGRAGGAVLNATIKSGTNNLHGSLWEFLRNDKLDAADYFQNANRQPKGPFKQNQFGATAGGPLVKNKTFWFVDYEGTRVRQSTLQTVTVPTLAERSSGFTDFSDLLSLQSGNKGIDALGRPVVNGTVYDPTTTRLVNGQYVRDPFPGNKIPAGRIDPNALKLISLYPEPTSPELYNNYAVNRSVTDDTDSFDVRIDQNLGSKDFIFGRYSFSDTSRVNPGPFDGYADGGGWGHGTTDIRQQGAAFSYTHSFSPSTINEFRVGFNREHVYYAQPYADDTSNIPEKFGVPGVVQAKGNGGLPLFSISGLQQLGAGGWLASDRFSNTYQLSENLTKIYGSHTFKGGVELQKIDFPWFAPPTSRGQFSFDGRYTSYPDLTDSSTGRVQFLLSPGPDGMGGASTVAASNFGGVASNKVYDGVYFQDDWKVTRQLTLNLGIRWDYFGAVGERYGAQANFVPGVNPQYIIPESRKGKPQLSQSFMNLLAKNGIDLVYSDKYGSGLARIPKNNFAPRFGFAYQLNSKVVLRGGYGIYYGGAENRGGYPSLGYNYPFQYDFSFRAPNNVAGLTFPNGAPATLETGLTGIPLNPEAVSGNGLNLRGIQLDYKTASVQSFNLTTQYEFIRGNSIEVGYVGSLGRHLETFVGTNLPMLMLPPGVNPQPYVAHPDFARGSSYASTNGNSHYHSLQAKFERRFSKGLDASVAYTWGKTLTNAGDALSGGNVGGLRAPWLPGWGLQKDMGLAAFDVRHSLTIAGTYELPFGRGKPFLSNSRGLSDAVLGNWIVNWNGAFYSGQPFSVGCPVATSAFGCYALVVGDIYSGSHNVQQFLNPAAFANPPKATTVGQSDYSPLGGGRTAASGPPYHKLDMSVFKQFPIKERFRLEFRAESFNLTNSPSFANPGSLNFTDAKNFARITSTRFSGSDARQLQFALKLYY
jgi:hypothetical protein